MNTNNSGPCISHEHSTVQNPCRRVRNRPTAAPFTHRGEQFGSVSKGGKFLSHPVRTTLLSRGC